MKNISASFKTAHQVHEKHGVVSRRQLQLHRSPQDDLEAPVVASPGEQSRESGSPSQSGPALVEYWDEMRWSSTDSPRIVPSR
ncbi:MAG: hypothetical protein ACYC6N_00945 [Pirellulaceae bacterium]